MFELQEKKQERVCTKLEVSTANRKHRTHGRRRASDGQSDRH